MTPPPRAKSWPRRMINAIVAIPLALWVFAEEWLWEGMLRVMRWVAKLPPVAWAETQIGRLPPYAALIAFLIPAAVLLPFKLMALWLLAHGQKTLGVMVFVIAKIVGTAFLARIFSLTKPALMSIGWFARSYLAFTGWKDRLYAYVRATAAYRLAKAFTRALRVRAKSAWLRLRRKAFGTS
jgi:hypothetical protein